ncbi:hypothetical protein Tsubulata_023978 [Turnera subulata]|uniref:LysM domain-containing protein n=1 Tax=Turnera subulata TaxID=218843 RepID=A0A9Q0GJE1_9ROSI|nr:hypothetical protein Tsubulata_023978 [Turnera subulata]
MEVKLSYRQRPSLAIPNPETPCFKWRVDNSGTFKRHFVVFQKRWRFNVQNKTEAQTSINENSVDAVKGGETFTSISKQYEVSIHSIAIADRNILNIDPAFKGQLVSTTASSSANNQLSEESHLAAFDREEEHRGSLHILDGLPVQKQFIMLTTHVLPHAKSTSYFLLLVPLITFCIGCIVASFHARVTKGRQVVNESRNHHNETRSMRWKHVLSDIREADELDADSSPKSTGTAADQDKNSFEDASHQYNKLEYDYKKFLSECGISDCGYWRGGSPQ